MLFDDVELIHTWTVPPDAWYLKFYLWLWQAKPNEVTFCKLFWGYVFTLPVLPFRLVFYPVLWVIVVFLLLFDGLRWIKRRIQTAFKAWTADMARAEAERLEREREEIEARRSTRPISTEPRFMQKRLSNIEHGAAWVNMGIREAWGAGRAGGIAVVRVAKHPVIFTASATKETVVIGGATLAGAMVKFSAVLAKVGWFLLDVLAAVLLWTGEHILGPAFTPIAKAWVWFWDHALRHVCRWVARGSVIALVLAGKAMLITIAVAAALALLAAIVYGIYEGGRAVGHIHLSVKAWSAWAFTALVVAAKFALHYLALGGLVLAGVIVLIAACIAMAWLYGKVFDAIWDRWLWPAFWKWLCRPTKYTVVYTARGVQKGTVGFGTIMLVGLKSVKANTCPRIIVEGTEAEASAESEDCMEKVTA